jgi:hypothetical protein
VHLSRETKSVGLVVFTGLVVYWVRAGLDKHWKSLTWSDFFSFWFLDAFTVLVVSGIAVTAIIFTENFFVGRSKDEDYNRVFFYIVMTILIVALFVGFIASGGFE